MKKRGKESKMNVALTAMLVVFVCMLSFSIGVISGKGWSDRDYKVKHIESDVHLKQAQQDVAPIGDEMTEKEVELLTEKALKEARAEAPAPTVEEAEGTTDKPVTVAQNEEEESEEESSEGEEGDEESEQGADETKKDVSAKMDMKKNEPKKRKVSSLMPKLTTPQPTAIEYTVQVAAYKTMDEAEKHSQKLIDKGFPAFPVKTEINDQIWYRVSIGSFKNRKQAVKYQKDLKKQAMVKTSFVRKIQRK